jgi:hypothetical protein
MYRRYHQVTLIRNNSETQFQLLQLFNTDRSAVKVDIAAVVDMVHHERQSGQIHRTTG